MKFGANANAKSSSNGSGFGGGSNPSQRKSPNFSLLKILIYAMYAGLGAAIVWFISMNIAPYKAIAANSGAEMFRNGFVSFILWLPIIGGIVKALGNSIAWIAALLFWLPIQVAEILPGVLWRHHGFLTTVAVESDRASAISIKDGDGSFVKSAKKQANSFVNSFLRNMWMWCLTAYLVDFFICITYYPLIPGADWGKTATLLMLGQWKRINMNNLFGVFSTLFAVEIIVHILITVWMLHKFIRVSSRNN